MDSHVYTFLFGTMLVGLLLCVTEPLTRRARDACKRTATELSESTDIVSSNNEAAIPKQIPEYQRALHHLGHVCSASGLLGLLFVPILVTAIPINIQVLAEVFSYIVNRPGFAILETTTLGIDYALTDLDLFAALLAMNLLVLGSVYAQAHEAGWRASMRALVLSTLILIIGFEVVASADCGYFTASEIGSQPWRIASYRGAIAFITACAEALGGFFSIHHFLLPSAQALLWSLAAPVRTLRAWRWRKANTSRNPISHQADPRFAIRFGRWLDEGLFDPLRQLDVAVGRLLRLNRRTSNA